jgi:hypothetical protein
MSTTKSSGYMKATAMLAALLITTVMFRSLVWFSGADGLPNPNDATVSHGG